MVIKKKWRRKTGRVEKSEKESGKDIQRGRREVG
jgi:hypothetical protein